jgi:hypothetical protein
MTRTSVILNTIDDVVSAFQKRGYIVNPSGYDDKTNEFIFTKQMNDKTTLRIFIKKGSKTMKVYIETYSINGTEPVTEYVEEDLLDSLAFNVWGMTQYSF